MELLVVPLHLRHNGVYSGLDVGFVGEVQQRFGGRHWEWWLRIQELLVVFRSM